MWNWIKDHRAKVAGAIGVVSGLIAAKQPTIAHVLDQLVKLLGN